MQLCWWRGVLYLLAPVLCLDPPGSSYYAYSKGYDVSLSYYCIAYNGEGFGFRLDNSGNGLAKINSYQLYNDSIYFNSWFEL